MFTGITQEIGKVEKISKTGSLIKLGIKSRIIFNSSKISDSVSVNGVCLTLVKKEKDLLFFEAVTSTFKNTNIKRLKKGSLVNLEPALSLGDRLGGHFVLGHVDTELKLRRSIKKGETWELEIELPSAFRKFLIKNGSIALEGISLTIKKILPRFFTINVIPFTYESTTLKHKKPGDWLNIEFDYLLKKNR